MDIGNVLEANYLNKNKKILSDHPMQSEQNKHRGHINIP